MALLGGVYALRAWSSTRSHCELAHVPGAHARAARAPCSPLQPPTLSELGLCACV
jgi:hypothetical protein